MKIFNIFPLVFSFRARKLIATTTITSSQTYTVPAGAKSISITCIPACGGGGGGGNGVSSMEVPEEAAAAADTLLITLILQIFL